MTYPVLGNDLTWELFQEVGGRLIQGLGPALERSLRRSEVRIRHWQGVPLLVILAPTFKDSSYLCLHWQVLLQQFHSLTGEKGAIAVYLRTDEDTLVGGFPRDRVAGVPPVVANPVDIKKVPVVIPVPQLVLFKVPEPIFF